MLDCTGNRESYVLGCGMLDTLNPFQNDQSTTQIKWGKNETRPYSTHSSANTTYEVADYDSNPTPLYKSIESKKWTTTLKILNDKNVNTKQASAWISRRNKDGGLQWRMTCLHSCILSNAPHEVIKSLLEVAPHIASCADDNGMVPLHLAFQNGASDEIIYELLVAFPMGIDAKDKERRTPLQCGISSEPNNYRWKMIGTYIAVMKVQKKKEIAAADGSNAKITRVKKMYELEMEHLNLEFDSKINECNSKLINSEKEILNKQEIIAELKDELKQEAEKNKSLQKSLENSKIQHETMEKRLQLKENEIIEAIASKNLIEKRHNELISREIDLNKKVSKLENELHDYRNSFFGGSFRSLFDCSGEP